MDNPSTPLRVCSIGCGGHAVRNVFPVFQHLPLQLEAVCDLDPLRAAATKSAFGAKRHYTDHQEMLAKEKPDAVFVVTGYDKQGRPLYPQLAVDAMQAGCHVWIEKPPAAETSQIELMMEASKKYGKLVMTGMKKMFFPANEKAKEISDSKEFGGISLLSLQYPQFIPEPDDFKRYYDSRESNRAMIGFVDHLCHPVSLLLFLAGMPNALSFERNCRGGGVVTFCYSNGSVASLLLTEGMSHNGGMERTMIISKENPMHVTVENNIKVTLHRNPPGIRYGQTPSYFLGDPGTVSAVWEPEFSLGNLYNKGLFLLGYYGEIHEFVSAVMEKRELKKCHLDHAWQATRILEAFKSGPGKTISLEKGATK